MAQAAQQKSATDVLLEQVAKLQAENERLKAKQAAKAKITCKVSEKGACSVYGLGRFPVTLYREQWERLMAHKDEILTFIKANEDSLKVKGEQE